MHRAMWAACTGQSRRLLTASVAAAITYGRFTAFADADGSSAVKVQPSSPPAVVVRAKDDYLAAAGALHADVRKQTPDRAAATAEALAAFVEGVDPTSGLIHAITSASNIEDAAVLFLSLAGADHNVAHARSVARLLCAWASLPRWPSARSGVADSPAAAAADSGAKPSSGAGGPNTASAAIEKLRAGMQAAQQGGGSGPSLGPAPVLAEGRFLEAARAMLNHSDPLIRMYGAKALSNLVVESDHGFERFGGALLQDLSRVLQSTRQDRAWSQSKGRESLVGDTHGYAAIALAGCCSKQGFAEEQYVSSQAARALVDAVRATQSEEDAKEPRFAITALRELALKAQPEGQLEAQLAKLKVAGLFLEQATGAPNVWTRRSACKALTSLLKTRDTLLRQGGIDNATLVAALKRAGKDDWMCDRWRRDADKWLAVPASARKKWWES